MKPFQAYKDLHSMSEDERINHIGNSVMASGLLVGICTDDEPGKPERYIKKLTERFPKIKIIETVKGPVAGIVTIKVKAEK